MKMTESQINDLIAALQRIATALETPEGELGAIEYLGSCVTRLAAAVNDANPL